MLFIYIAALETYLVCILLCNNNTFMIKDKRELKPLKFSK